MSHRIQKTVCLLLMLACLWAVPNVQADTFIPQTMYVQTGNAGKLYLRTAPSMNAPSVGLYPNGTPVQVYAQFNNWVYVTLDGKAGYMMLQYLSASPIYVTPTPSGTPVPVEHTQMIVKTGNSGRLYLRQSASKKAASLGLYPNGTMVTVLARVNEWAFVQVDGKTGYMMLRYLSGTLTPTPVPTLKPVVTPTPVPTWFPVITPTPTATPTAAPSPKPLYSMIVRTGNTGKLFLRAAPSQSARALDLYANGTVVDVYAMQGEWVQVITPDHKAGWMMVKYLAYIDTPVKPTAVPTAVPVVTATPTAVPTATPVPTAAPSPKPLYSMVVRTGNTGKLYLRAAPSRSTAAVGLYANGTVVDVYKVQGDWVQVITPDNKAGWMMTKYLAYIDTPVKPTAAPTAAPTQSPAGKTATVIQPNGSYVNLRAYRNSEVNNVVARVPSGSVVKVLETDPTWSKVQYGTTVGYMVTHYLH